MYIHTLIIKSDDTVPGFKLFCMGKFNKMFIILRKIKNISKYRLHFQIFHYIVYDPYYLF